MFRIKYKKPLLFLVALLTLTAAGASYLLRDNCTKYQHCSERRHAMLWFIEKATPAYFVLKDKLMFYDKAPQHDVDEVYRMLDLVDKAFRKNGIDYYISDGTLLGSVRHGGMIPWDDDVDLVALNADRVKLAKALMDIVAESAGRYYFSANAHLLRIAPVFSGSLVAIGGVYMAYTKTPQIDIVVGLEKSPTGDYFYRPVDKSLSFKFFPENRIKKLSDVYPTKDCKFGPLTLRCPNKTATLLENQYGKKVMDEAITYNHSFNDGRKKRIQMTEEMRKPALPSWAK